MEHKLNYDFLQVEFKELYKGFNGVKEEKEICKMCTEILNLLEDTIKVVFLKNHLFFDKNLSLAKNIASLIEIDILPKELGMILFEYITDISNIRKEYSINTDINESKESFSVLYELFVWLVLNYGEENYTLFYEKLNTLEKSVFSKYINEKNITREANEYNRDNQDEEGDDVRDEENGDYNNIETIYIISDDDDEIGDVDLSDEEDDTKQVNKEIVFGEEYLSGDGVEKDYVKARGLFENAAKEGNIEAQGYLAIFYEKGLGGDKDISKAIYWYKKSAINGNAFSQYSLGYIYFSGKYLDKNVQYAFQWYKKAAENDFPAAQYALSYLYKNGIGCEEDMFKAYYWLEKAADNNFEDAYYVLGQSYLEGSFVEMNHKKAFIYLSKGAEAGEENCLESLGDMYYWGFHVDKDIEKAFNLYKKSMNKGNLKLYYKVGRLYEDEGDIDRAKTYYLIGHNSRDVRATQRLGTLYYKGIGVEKNIKTAIQYMKLAAEEKSPYAIYVMGVYYLGISREKGIKYLEEAYEYGSSNAAEVLISELLIDVFNEKIINYKKLLEYIDMAMKNDREEAIYYYGLVYAYGIGVEKNNEEAFKYLKMAAEKGSEKAMIKLGNWYKNGVFVLPNPKEALKWYKKASEKFNVDALLNIIEIYEKGIGVLPDYEKALEGVKLLKGINEVQGNLKLAYYYLMGIGVERNKKEAKKYIDKVMRDDEKKALDLLGMLAEEELYDLKKEEAEEYYLKSVKLGYGKAYINLQYYLYKNNQDINKYNEYTKYLSKDEYLDEIGKNLYIKAILTLKEGKDNGNENLIEKSLNELKKSVNLGFYEGIKDIVHYYEECEETEENLMNLYRYKQKLIYYNIIY